MPDPIGLQAPGLSKISLVRQTNPTTPFLPTEQDVAQERQRLENEPADPGLLFKALTIPGRLLGGQSIQGFLESVGEDGIGEGLRKAFINNPLFQILDAIPGVDDLLGDALESVGLRDESFGEGIVEDTSFVKVREAFGWKALDNKVADFFLNLGGELVTSPFELFWTPFGKIGEAALKGAEVSADLGKAVDAGQRALIAFHVPIVGARFSFQPFKNLDVYFARVLQSTADFVNSSPVVQPILKLFNAKQVKSADAEVRATTVAGLEKGNIASREFQVQVLPILQRIAEEAPEVLSRNKTLQRYVADAAEVGVRGIDTKEEALVKLQGGLDLVTSRNARDSFIDSELERLAAALEGGKQARSTLVELTDEIDQAMTRGGEGVAPLVEEYQTTFPHTALPDSVVLRSDDFLDEVGIRLRPGVDRARPHAPSFTDPAFEKVIDDAIGEDLPNQAGVRARSKLAQDTEGTLEESLVKHRETEVPGLIEEIFNVDSSGELLAKLNKVAEEGTKLMNIVKDTDLAQKFITSVFEPYFPRDISPAVMKSIQARWSEAGLPRDVRELTILEFNSYVLEHGTKALGFKTVGEAVESARAETIWKVLDEIFPDSFVQKIKAIDQKAAEFFDTNPFRAWYRRIEKSAAKKRNVVFFGHLFEKGSPLIGAESTLKEITQNPAFLQEQLSRGYIPLLVESDGQGVKFSALDSADLFSDAFNLNERAKHAVVSDLVSGWVDTQLAEGKVTVDEVLGQLQELRKSRLRYKGAARPEFSAKTSELKRSLVEDLGKTQPERQAITKQVERRQTRLKIMEKDLEELKKGPFADSPLVTNLEDQAEVLRSWDKVARDSLEEHEIKVLNGDLDERLGAKKTIENYEKRISQRKVESSGLRKELSQARKDLRAAKSPREINAASKRVRTLQRRVQSMRESVADLKKNIKKVRESVKTSGKYRKGLIEKGEALRDAKYSELTKKEISIRQGIENGIDDIEGAWKSFQATQKGAKQGAKRSLAQIREAVQEGGGNTRRFNDFLRLWKKQKDHGVLALTDLQEQFPEVYQRIVTSKSNARVVFTDQANYKNILAPETGFLSQLDGPDPLRSTFHVLDSLTSWWKAWTVLPPVFLQSRMRDAATNILMQAQGGASFSLMMRSMPETNKFVGALGKALKKSDMSLLETFEVPEYIAKATGAKTGKELFEYMWSRGIVNNNLFKDQYTLTVGDVAIDTGKRLKLKDAKSLKEKVRAVHEATTSTRGVVIEKGAQFAEFLDNESRVSAFFAHLRQGKDAEGAAQLVRAWGYDPRQLDFSSFERSILRRFIPFYSFTKFAVQSQMKAFFTKPGTVTIFKKLADAAEQMTGLTPSERETILPDFIKDGFGVPSSVRSDGKIMVTMFGSSIPLGEVAQLASAFEDTFSGDASDDPGFGALLLSKMSPWVKVPMELLMGRSAYTQRPISRFPGEQVEFMGVEMSADLRHTLMSIRFLNEIDNLGIFSSKQVASILGAARSRRREREITTGIGRSLAGSNVRVTEANDTLLSRLGESSFSPIPFKRIPLDTKRTLNRAEARESVQLSGLRRKLKGTLRRKSPENIRKDNLDTLKRLIAKKIAEVDVIEELKDRLPGGK